MPPTRPSEASSQCGVDGLPSKVLGALVIVAGGRYLIDSLGEILVPGYAVSLAVFTFVGEVLLSVWLVWLAIRGLPSGFLELTNQPMTRQQPRDRGREMCTTPAYVRSAPRTADR